VTTTLGFLLPGASRRARHVVYRNYRWFRAAWWVVVSGAFEPLFYLLSIGVGVGELVGDVELAGRSVDYTTFVAPAMLASAAMNGAVFESTANVFAKLRWSKNYLAMTSTPLTPTDIALGELTFSQLRGAAYALAFLVTMVAFGLVESWWAILALPASVLIGVAFAAVGLAGATYMRGWEDLDLVTLVQVPLFLFSATFYPLSTYPEPLRTIVQLSPLYHGVALCRDLVLGDVGATDVMHVAVLVAMAFAGLRLAGRRFQALLYA